MMQNNWVLELFTKLGASYSNESKDKIPEKAQLCPLNEDSFLMQDSDRKWAILNL